MTRPAIVVVGYDRPGPFARLLGAIAAARYPDDAPVTLVLSLDGGGSPAVRRLAEDFPWPAGEKRLILHGERLGLRRHILSCGDLSAQYGAVIVLEDDLFVAPSFYGYACQAAAFYAGEARVAGVSLYSYRINEFTNLAFVPVEDGFDSYFLQIAASWGQMWTAAQWQGFRAWHDRHAAEGIPRERGYPLQLSAWKESSWKKYFIRYLVETGRLFAFPRAALSTNFAAPGTHTKRDVGIYQVPLLHGRRSWRFAPVEASSAIYDAHFALMPEAVRRRCAGLAGIDVAFDLLGEKRLAAIGTEWLVSARPCTRPVRSFGLDLVPLEDNIAFAIPGDVFHLGRTADFGSMTERMRRRLIKHMNAEAFWNKYVFQLLKPLQTRLKLVRAAPAPG